MVISMLPRLRGAQRNERSGGPLLRIGDLLSDVGEENTGISPDQTPPSSATASDLPSLFQENFDELKQVLAGTDHSWTVRTLKLCSALDTANILVESTNSRVPLLLLEKVKELRKIVSRRDSA